MSNLVLKDILIQKKSLATSILFAIIMVIAFQGKLGNGAYMMGAMGIVFLLIAGAFMYDEKSRGDALVNSLPVKRSEVVAARYISLVVFSLSAIALVALAGAAIRLLGIFSGLSIISLTEIAGIFFVLCFMFSIYIPIYFKYGYVKSRAINIILYVSLFAVSGLVSGLRKAVIENPDDSLTLKLMSIVNSIPDWMSGSLLVIITFAVLLSSMALSTRFYSKREF